MKKIGLVLALICAVFLNINSLSAFTWMTTTPSIVNVGTNSFGYFYPGGTPFKVNIYGAPASTTMHCNITHPSGVPILSGYITSQICPIDASGNYYFWVYPGVTFPMTPGSFYDDLIITLVEDPTVSTSFGVQGVAIPPVGITDYINITSCPTPISPAFGTCTSSFCPITYSAHFNDLDGPTSMISWTWSIKLQYKNGTYVVPATLWYNSVNSDYTIFSSFTLPNYDWIRDANNDILGQVTVDGFDSDGFTHHAGSFIGVKFPPNKATVSIKQTCPDLQLTYNSVGATSYKIYYSTIPGPPYNGTGITQGNSPISVGSATDFTLTGLAVGTTYYITVKGVNSNGESVSYSNELVYTPMNCNDNIVGCITATNLVTNGEFNSGNTGFTSGLSYNGTCFPASYFVGTQLTSKCSSWSTINFTDHTSGTGNFLIVDGHQTTGCNLWNQNVTVNANTTYTFSFWARSLYAYPFNLGFLVNGVTINTTPSITSGSWTKYSTTWFSGSVFGSIPLNIKQLTGDDFRDLGIDDIYFGHCNDLVHGCSNPFNLAVNGNFSSGNTGFTSALLYGSNCFSGYYFVGPLLSSKCSGWASANFTDHTTGTGNYMIIDGNASAASNVWNQNVSVNPNTSYTFSFWARSIYSQPFSVEFRINGTTVGATAAITLGSWTQYSVNWFSGMISGTIPIALRQQSGGAYRDFGIDDIYFGYCGSGRRVANPEQENQPAAMLVYPNPNNGTFTIQTNSSESKDVFVYDMMGKLIYSVQGNSELNISIDITDQPAGIYNIQVLNGNSIDTKRIIKQ
ncbi:MAG: T9SS type A sorting domain-containing protein [Bacteroidota bacterium]|nr:T9SS type A sorting domain-containing protein [Bacteroidota bacterium]